MDNINKLFNLKHIHAQGITGKSVCIATLDTGISKHDDFDHRIIGFADMIGKMNSPYDNNGHGTHVAGIIGGSGFKSKGRYKGIAPECKIVAVKVLNGKGNGKVRNVMKGIEWILHNKSKFGIRVVNISIGTEFDVNDPENWKLIHAVEEMWENGIAVVVAAGNNGPKSDTITVPGNTGKAIFVKNP